MLQQLGGAMILVADDDPHIRQVVCFALKKGGFECVEASDGQEALLRFREREPELIVLDLGMPELDGFEVCRRVRATAETPIIFLTSRDDEIDRILGLELGGDDYVTKPFSPRELVARVRAVLRRARPVEPALEPSQEHAKSHGDLTLDPHRFEARIGGDGLVLTVTEFNLLSALMGFPGKVYTRGELMSRAYGEDIVVSERTIDSHIRRVRQKCTELGVDPIETVHGLGYRLSPCRRG